MEEKALRSGDYPFGYLSPVGTGKPQQEPTADFVADDQPIRDQDLTETPRDVRDEFKAA